MINSTNVQLLCDLAFIIAVIVIIQQTGFNNSIGTNRNIDKTPFYPYFSILKNIRNYT